MPASFACPNPRCPSGTSHFLTVDAVLAHLRLSETCHPKPSTQGQATLPVAAVPPSVDLLSNAVTARMSTLPTPTLPLPLALMQPSLLQLPYQRVQNWLRACQTNGDEGMQVILRRLQTNQDQPFNLNLFGTCVTVDVVLLPVLMFSDGNTSDQVIGRYRAHHTEGKM